MNQLLLDDKLWEKYFWIYMFVIYFIFFLIYLDKCIKAFLSSVFFKLKQQKICDISAGYYGNSRFQVENVWLL